MTADKLVSVIIPVYNAEKHLAATLTSIINQDYDNLEIVIVNDASTDSSRDIAQKLLAESGRNFQIIDHEKNRRVSAARNTGIYAAHGEYLWFCDSDDLAERNFVSELLRSAEEKNADVAFCGFRHYYEDEKRYEYVRSSLAENVYSGEKVLEAWIAKTISFRGVWNCLFSKKFLIDSSLRFFERCLLGEDEEFTVKALVAAKRISYVNKVLYAYVKHPEQSVAKYAADNVRLKMFKHVELAILRSGRYIRKNAQSRKLKIYAAGFILPDIIVKTLTISAQVNDYEQYNRTLKKLRHKSIRKLMIFSARFIAFKPELFFKSLMLLYAPNLYYKLRKGKQQ